MIGQAIQAIGLQFKKRVIHGCRVVQRFEVVVAFTLLEWHFEKAAGLREVARAENDRTLVLTLTHPVPYLPTLVAQRKASESGPVKVESGKTAEISDGDLCVKQGAVPHWYKARAGVRTRALSGAARVAKYRPQKFN